jgi:hypothetical protein
MSEGLTSASAQDRGLEPVGRFGIDQPVGLDQGFRTAAFTEVAPDA